LKGAAFVPIDDYDGNTFVAFLDISGFKTLMRDERRALRALDRFYQAGFAVLGNQNAGNDHASRVDGFFVSDSGILFVRGGNEELTQQLQRILMSVQEINRQVLQNEVMLTTSVAYGHFSYHGRLEFPGIEKNPIYGEAYVQAFLDNENGSPKIQPGQCRVIKRNLPDGLTNVMSRERTPFLSRLQNERSHYYFYWMVEQEEEIEQFRQQYSNAYDLKYAGILKALKRR
jgi:hypothetical protein